jgi:hypothetical protein
VTEAFVSEWGSLAIFKPNRRLGVACTLRFPNPTGSGQRDRRRSKADMDTKNVVSIRRDADKAVGPHMCGSCHMEVARFAPQVVADSVAYHRECYEAWYFARHGRRPSLLPGANGDRHRFQVRDRAAA